MHEISIARALLRQVEAEALRHEAVSVRRVRVRLGTLSGIEPALLHSAFEFLCEAGRCAGAELTIDEVPATWSCPDCGAPIEGGLPLRCPRCRAPGRLSAGDEMLLVQIEMEVA
jgi:hydrogenase nickel incorporation protein HypA/HybF